MIIDFDENILSIKDASLKSNQISQLKFWGFKSVGKDAFTFSGDETGKLLKKIIAYFQKEKLTFKPTKNGQAKINSIAEQTAEFRGIKKLGEDFKKGVYDKKQFKEFEKFFKT